MAQKSDDHTSANNICVTLLDSPLGRLRISSDQQWIRSVLFADDKKEETFVSSPEDMPFCLQQCRLQLTEYFNGARRIFDLPLQPVGTPFQLNVWARLQDIPFGRSISYAELAKRLGDPKTIRAAGTANGRNPIAIIIPCHRVIGSTGQLVGYAGELWRKKWLLDHENRIANGVLPLF